MTFGDDDPALQFVDLVLHDLAFGGPVYVGRRPGAAAAGRVMIQSGEEGRRELALPDLSSPESVETFVADLQAHVSDVHNALVPACPVDSHDHAVVCRSADGAVRWVCPDAEWCSPTGECDERNWPPTDLDAEEIPDRTMTRIFRRDIDVLREAHPERRRGWLGHPRRGLAGDRRGRGSTARYRSAGGRRGVPPARPVARGIDDDLRVRSTAQPHTHVRDQNQWGWTGRWRPTVSLTHHGLKVVRVLFVEPRGVGD
jgi:hypothetical protein